MHKLNKKTVNYLLHGAVLAGLVVAAVKYLDSDALLEALRRFNWLYLFPILLLAIGYVLVKGWRFVVMMRELTPTSEGVILRAYIAGQASTLLPGGIAARAGILDQVGVPVADSAATIMLSSLSDQAVLICAAVLSALWFDAARLPVVILLAVLTVISLLLGVESIRTHLLELIEKVLGKLRVLHHWREFLESIRQVATLPILLGGIGNSILAFALLVFTLDLAVRGVGAQIPYLTLLLAFTLPSLLGRISAMPGGVGVTEAGMVGILDAAPGVTLDQAAAAVLVFRAGTVLFAALAGSLVYFFGWRGAAEAVR